MFCVYGNSVLPCLVSCDIVFGGLSEVRCVFAQLCAKCFIQIVCFMPSELFAMNILAFTVANETIVIFSTIWVVAMHLSV